ncbi:MAG: hypothetical protein ACO3F9_00770 [Burkholderiales bacterium]
MEGLENHAIDDADSINKRHPVLMHQYSRRRIALRNTSQGGAAGFFPDSGFYHPQGAKPWRSV